MNARADAFAVGQRELFERIVSGATLGPLLEDIVRLIEAQAEGMLCSILLLDAGARAMHQGAAPSLPVASSRLIDGLPSLPEADSCGGAAQSGERMIGEDIETRPCLAKDAHATLPHGRLACWSSPILSAERKVLGTFTMYYRETRGPTPAEVEWVNAGTHLASIAIVRDKCEQERQGIQNERQLQQAQRMQALGTRAGRIAHDFNNILTAISSHAQLALHGLPSEHPLQASLTEIRNASGRATELVRQIYSLGRRDEPRREGLETRAAAADVRAEQPTAVEAQGEHILYVDDEEALVFLAARILKRMGYRVSAYSSSEQALREFRLRAGEFDAMVTDISMPGLSGVELVREVLQIRPDLPVVMTTGYIRPEDVASAQRLGVKDVIPKPNTIEDLAGVLRRVLTERRAALPA